MWSCYADLHAETRATLDGTTVKVASSCHPKSSSQDALPLPIRTALRKFLDTRNLTDCMRIILPPIKWDHANDGLDVRELNTWMRDFELQQLPSDAIFPRPGELWETTCDCVVTVAALIKWPAQPRSSQVRLPSGEDVYMPGFGKPLPFFPFGKAQLQTGERVRILGSDEAISSAWPKPIFVNVRPLRYEQLEEGIVPKELRDMPGYTGYLLNVRTARPRLCFDTEQAFLNDHFRLIETVA